MNIREVLLAAPPVGDPNRVSYFESNFGQLVGWMTDEDKQYLVDWLPFMALNYPVQPMRLVETGTFAGSTARGLIALSGGGKITCIDNWHDVHVENPKAQWEETLRRKVDLLDYATLIEGDHKKVGETWRNPIDLLLIDADHAYIGAISDMKNLAEHVVRGGYCLVDDYNMTDVRRACDEFFTAKWRSIRIPVGPDSKLACWRRR